MTAALIAAIVIFLSAYFTYVQVTKLHEQQLAKGELVGRYLAQDVRSAVAFADRETAREVLAPLGSDAEIVTTILYADHGEELFQRGTPGAWAERVRDGVTELRSFRSNDLLVIVAPVESLEGPRGTLLIEMSMAAATEHARRVLWLAIGIGVGVLAFGVLVTWLISRSLVRRLRAIDDVASAVASGARTEGEVKVDSHDEVGRLAASFNVMLAKLAESNRNLEARVEKRTCELQTEMQRRTKIELELRQAQKLESVGRLAAGVAHEINTPIQFVSDSCAFVQEAIDELMSLLAARKETITAMLKGEITPEAAIARAHQIDADHDLDYLVKQLPEAARRAQSGLERVASIVRALKEFAYADRTEQMRADLNRAIQSTLTIAHSEYKFLADVETDFGDVPMTMCHVGELNQVVLNLIVNSAHAIEQVVRGTECKGQIRIRTSVDGDHAVIELADTGCGIPKANLDKIFDPFFTTKEVGKGSGQGLAIARSVIVDKHGGTMTAVSEVGTGTTFTIRIPIDGTGTHVEGLAA